MTVAPTGMRSWLRERRERGAEFAELVQQRYSRLFWALHSAWALLTGIAVLVLAHNRYGFVRWVVLFVGLTWASTLFFSRFAVAEAGPALRFARGLVSYLTRVMYQETLFFLLPFYFYSTTFPSWNCLYVTALACVAALSCYDLLFDELLRTNGAFAVGFFAFVSFSALQFFLPLLLRMHVSNASMLAAALAFGGAAALAYDGHELRDRRRLALLAVSLAGVLGAVWVLRPLLPPVPLRLTRVRFAGTFDPRTFHTGVDFATEMPATALRHDRLYVIATVFSPQRVPARVRVRMLRDGTEIRESRVVNVTARPGGFRVWDAVPVDHRPATYTAEVWTGERQLIGRAKVSVRN